MVFPSTQDSGSRRALRCALILLLPAIVLTGCATAVRMDNRLDATSLEERPQPTAPDDYFLWLVRPVSTTLVPRAGGGSWASVRPTEVFLADPSSRRQVVLAYSEALTTNPPARLRGVTKIRLDGYGRVFIGLQAVPVGSAAPGGFIGGMVIDVPPLNPSSGTLYATQFFDSERVLDIYPLPSAGTLGPYTPGTVTEFQWVIDQSTRSLSVTIPHATGPAPMITYPAAMNGISNAPLPKLMVSVWLQQIGPSTNLFLDDFVVEEFDLSFHP